MKSILATGLSVLLASFFLSAPMISYAKAPCECSKCAHHKYYKKHHAAACKEHCASKGKDCAGDCTGK